MSNLIMETTTNNPQFLPSNNSAALRRGARKPSVAAGTAMDLTSSAVADEGGENGPAYICLGDGTDRTDCSYIHYDTDQGRASDGSQESDSDDESSLTSTNGQENSLTNGEWGKDLIIPGGPFTDNYTCTVGKWPAHPADGFNGKPPNLGCLLYTSPSPRDS